MLLLLPFLSAGFPLLPGSMPSLLLNHLSRVRLPPVPRLNCGISPCPSSIQNKLPRFKNQISWYDPDFWLPSPNWKILAGTARLGLKSSCSFWTGHVCASRPHPHRSLLCHTDCLARLCACPGPHIEHRFALAGLCQQLFLVHPPWVLLGSLCPEFPSELGRERGSLLTPHTQQLLLSFILRLLGREIKIPASDLLAPGNQRTRKTHRPHTQT